MPSHKPSIGGGSKYAGYNKDSYEFEKNNNYLKQNEPPVQKKDE